MNEKKIKQMIASTLYYACRENRARLVNIKALDWGNPNLNELQVLFEFDDDLYECFVKIGWIDFVLSREDLGVRHLEVQMNYAVYYTIHKEFGE